MTKDLENTLSELGPGYREMVVRLCRIDESSLRSVAVSRGEPLNSRRRVSRWRLLAAALATVFLGFGAIYLLSSVPARDSRYNAFGLQPAACRVYTAAYVRNAAALQIIVSSQREDGGWQNDFLTRQNAAALRDAEDDCSRVAYKRALRYLRLHGLTPLSDEELRHRALAIFGI